MGRGGGGFARKSPMKNACGTSRLQPTQSSSEVKRHLQRTTRAIIWKRSPLSLDCHDIDSSSISWQTNKTTEDKEEDNLPLFLKIEEKLLAVYRGPSAICTTEIPKMLEAHVNEVEHGSIHRGDWFVSTSIKTRRGNGKRIRHIRLRRDSTLVRLEKSHRPRESRS